MQVNNFLNLLDQALGQERDKLENNKKLYIYYNAEAQDWRSTCTTEKTSPLLTKLPLEKIVLLLEESASTRPRMTKNLTNMLYRRVEAHYFFGFCGFFRDFFDLSFISSDYGRRIRHIEALTAAVQRGVFRNCIEDLHFKEKDKNKLEIFFSKLINQKDKDVNNYNKLQNIIKPLLGMRTGVDINALLLQLESDYRDQEEPSLTEIFSKILRASVTLEQQDILNKIFCDFFSRFRIHLVSSFIENQSDQSDKGEKETEEEYSQRMERCELVPEEIRLQNMDDGGKVALVLQLLHNNLNISETDLKRLLNLSEINTDDTVSAEVKQKILKEISKSDTEENLLNCCSNSWLSLPDKKLQAIVDLLKRYEEEELLTEFKLYDFCQQIPSDKGIKCLMNIVNLQFEPIAKIIT